MNINKYIDMACSKRTGTVLALFIIALFGVMSLTRSYPHENFKAILDDIGNDWGTYARYALDIKQNGILMPSVGTAYCLPSGFLYNYFIALFLVIFGENMLPIFVAQHIMLGLSVALIYWTFRDKMRNITSLLFLIALYIFAYKDVYRNYSSFLLSENLALFLMALFFFCFVRGFDRDKFFLQLSSAALLGLAILTRPNISIYGFFLIPLAAFYYLKRGRAGRLKLLIFITVLFLSASFLFVRNYLAVKDTTFFPSQSFSFEYFKNFHPVPPSVDLSRVEKNIFYAEMRMDKKYVNYIEYIMQEPRIFFDFYLKKIMFCLGHLHALTPYYGFRAHWAIMWFGYFLYMVFRAAGGFKFQLWENALNLYIISYYGSAIVVTSIHNYGFRMLLPALLFVLVPAFLAVDRLYSAIISRVPKRILPG